jgi:hypothetical protein
MLCCSAVLIFLEIFTKLSSFESNLQIVHGRRTIEEDLSKTIMPGPIMPYTFTKHKPIRQEGLLLHLQILVLGLSLRLP